ncbi:hypothetical protein DFO67_10411 [Modicisalibacter xianhensis]|uniref:Phage protein n=1 Tax=Modicisalibacter xianhensis TaxID=442341 RepID=A0A4R8G2D8_9GAMM|nr:hypothetical protein [Halomonas xianhensis]TDX30756.1 hypothetical protein DFO67_10411 [Halomonas xianhensis]
MCEPTTIAIAATAASGAFSAYQANQQGKYQQAVYKQQAKAQQQQASDARARGVIAGEEQRDRARALEARQATSLAGSGLDIGSGTSLDLFAETATLGEYDAQVTENNAARQAYGYQTEATNSLASARNARSAGRNRAIGTLLTSGAKAGNIYSQYG